MALGRLAVPGSVAVTLGSEGSVGFSHKVARPVAVTNLVTSRLVVLTLTSRLIWPLELVASVPFPIPKRNFPVAMAPPAMVFVALIQIRAPNPEAEELFVSLK